MRKQFALLTTMLLVWSVLQLNCLDASEKAYPNVPLSREEFTDVMDEGLLYHDFEEGCIHFDSKSTFLVIGPYQCLVQAKDNAAYLTFGSGTLATVLFAKDGASLLKLGSFTLIASDFGIVMENKGKSSWVSNECVYIYENGEVCLLRKDLDPAQVLCGVEKEKVVANLPGRKASLEAVPGTISMVFDSKYKAIVKFEGVTFFDGKRSFEFQRK